MAEITLILHDQARNKLGFQTAAKLLHLDHNRDDTQCANRVRPLVDPGIGRRAGKLKYHE
jgi:hypothetical protein